MSTELAETQVIDRALDLVSNPLIPMDEKGAAWALLYAVQRRIRRGLGLTRARGYNPKDDLIRYMEENKIKRLGPLSVTATPIDARYPVNDEGNWADAGTQEELELLAKVAPDFIRLVPQHFEIRTAELGTAVHAGDPVARKLWNMCKDRRWRVDEGKRLSLDVAELKPPREKAA